jgi:hypothetical protein
MSVRAQYSNLYPTNPYAAITVLDTWTVVRVTAVKFKPLIFSMWGFALSNIAYNFMKLAYICPVS